MGFHQGFKNLDTQKIIFHHFKKHFLKIEIFCLLVYGSIVVKMDNSHLFEEVLKFLFHAYEAMGNEIYKQHGLFSYMYVCVDIVVHFIIGLVTMIHYKKYTCLQMVQFHHLCAFHT